MWRVVGPDGKPHNIRVVRTLGLGLDEKAIEAVKNWRFEPAMKDGKPVAAQTNVDVNFNLHEKELNTRILELEEKVNAGDPKATFRVLILQVEMFRRMKSVGGSCWREQPIRAWPRPSS